MSELPKMLVIDYSKFPIENATDVELLCDELEGIAQDYPDYFPVFRIMPIEEPDGTL